MTLLQKVKTIVSVLNNAKSFNTTMDKFIALKTEWGVSDAEFFDLVAAVSFAIKNGKKRK